MLKKGFTLTIKSRKGFTLIELLIVMAILGVLAVVVLVAINPVQQLARTRDSGRKSAVTQIGHALEAYYTSHGGKYLSTVNCTAANGGPLSSNWMGCLVSAGELASAPSPIDYKLGTECDTASDPNAGRQNHICYRYNVAGQVVVYIIFESNSEQSKCASDQTAWFVWSTADGRGGVVCTDDSGGSPVPPGAGSQNPYWAAKQ
jgi:prepilin-type N-terminal cleavage/methylation domain-containing protein